jgi:hypothetical protein
MTAAELLAVAARTRAEATAALAKLDTVDLGTLPPLLRAEYESVRGGWLKLLSMTADDVVDLHLATCDAAGRQLREEESKGLLTKK